MLLSWPGGPAAAITEARVLDFAGMYLFRESDEETTLRTRLAPLPTRPQVCVEGPTPHVSPWRVVLLDDVAGNLVESNLLLCLNDPPAGDFSWAQPGKSTFHWWYGDFEDDHELPDGRETYVARHRQYIDFCAENNIAYHALSGDGLAWYQQSSTDYAQASADADVRQPRPEIGLPDVLAYARQRGVGIRLWVHWKALDEHLEEAMALYESWGVKGLMVDFLDRDDQEMIDFSARMLGSAARHKIHIQIHGSSKYSGEHRTFPHLFNREGVLNLEYVKWSKLCTPQHSVDVAYTRALAGPVDFHLGGFRSVSRDEFEPRDRKPVVMGTRCHHLALYLAYVNPMPMVADAPHVYKGQRGFELIREVPTTWDETRFVAGEPGEYFVVARRSGETWYLGGITNWTSRIVEVPLDFLGVGTFDAKCWVDGSQDPSRPNDLRIEAKSIGGHDKLKFEMASGGGFVVKFSPE
jgi:alpha-glucosidase